MTRIWGIHMSVWVGDYPVETDPAYIGWPRLGDLNVHEMQAGGFVVYPSDGNACTNQAGSFFSRLRRMEIGAHHHIAGPCLASYATEASFREDDRRVSNGGLAGMVGSAAMASRVSRQCKGYWQRGR